MANKKINKTLNIIFSVIAILLIIIIVPLMAISVTLIIKGSLNDEYPPDIFGYAPLTVASGSMTGNNEDSFDEGDLIFIRVLSDDEKQQLTMNEVICYKVDDIFVTHRIVGIKYADDGSIETLTTMGDANNTTDEAITLDNVFGVYTGRIANLGSFATFLQSSAGIAVFVGVPIIALIAFDVARVMILNRNKNAEKNLQNKDEEIQSKDVELQSKDEEIARLKKMLEQNSSVKEEGSDKSDSLEKAEDSDKAESTGKE